MVHREGLRASVIIPVYNKGKFLKACFKTLERQTMDHSSFEAVFVDDGSRDDSGRIIDEFVAKHAWARVIHKENGGVCSARNEGIDAARGTYLFYLDPDDGLTPNTLEDVCSFYDKHSDEVDLVTYGLTIMRFGEERDPHFRYDILTKSGVYDLTRGKNYLICQTTMNVCVKNRFAQNRHFDFESTNGIVFHEDQQYITEVLLVRLKIGYCAEASYIWNKNAESTVNTIVNPYYIFDNTMLMYEKLVQQCGGSMPRYLQAMFAHDVGWKLKEDAALPTHLSGEAYEQAMSRLMALLKMVEPEVLLSVPSVNPHHALYILQLCNPSGLRLLTGPGGTTVISDDVVVRVDKKVEVYFLRTRARHGAFEIWGIVKSPSLFMLRENPDFHLYATLKVGAKEATRELELRPSDESYYLSNTRTADFRSFRYTLPIDKPCDLVFTANFEGYDMDCSITNNRQTVTFGIPLLNTMFFEDAYIVLQAGSGTVHVGKRTKALYRAHLKNLSENLDKRTIVARLLIERTNVSLHKRYREVWLYTDAPHRLDNAWLQFCHDCTIDDGVMRYYIANGVEAELPPESVNAEVLPFGSRKHKTLHWVADKRLVSDVSQSSMSPWDARLVRPNYADYDNAEVIYLQHGVLWAHMPWYYGHDKVLVDREVVSTQFEIDNLTSNYGFEEHDLIPVGMARYDFIEHEQPAQKKVLLCPSWRSYLVGTLTSSGRDPLNDIFLKSEYYKSLQAFLTNERLHEVLSAHGYELDFKLHPNFACYAPLFKGLKGPVRLVETVENEASYAAIITDYSSYSFDFVYLNRAIIYFIPDEQMFHAGLDNYRELDMDLNDAMGEYAATADEAIESLNRILEHDGKPWGRYAQKERGFFLNYDNQQRDRLYTALCGND